MRLLLPVFILIASVAFGQSANIDKETINVSYIKLPSSPVLEFDKRTFKTTIPGLRINGFTKTDSNPTLDIEYTVDGTMVDNVDVEKKKYEKKDKDGNVISTYYRYKAKATYTTNSTLYVTNNNGGVNYDRNFSESFDFESSEYNSSREASSFYNTNKGSLLSKYRNSQRKSLEGSVKSVLASKYAYRPQDKNYSYLWILRSKKHPERDAHHKAYEEAKAAFDLMTPEGSTEEVAAALKPIMDYFEAVIPRFEGKKKKMRKVRFASLYNIATMYYYLDNVEKTAEYGQKIIDNDYSKSDGRQFIKMAENLKKSLETNQVDSRHFVIESPEVE
ncbi:hypothetical protein [Dokdonia sp. Hel_I_53]|uniref:hypothetical protein n=1 Tax=Dokdonia sp. Hel_I_53 TaxID=1566287 RepID=UPI00119A4721|nr:hypothetical protein [Dokdonia sp. Hel_I_53]TVZ53178.1 hypothetical protein OD90_2376 [Dokdonia sp. Hel_I_53]